MSSSGQDDDPTHPAMRLDDLVHNRIRLGILVVLSRVRRATFPYLKSLLNVTDGNLGRHLEVLAAEGLITLTKGYEGRRPRTWAELTEAGDAALASEMAVLRELVTEFDSDRSSRQGD